MRHFEQFCRYEKDGRQKLEAILFGGHLWFLRLFKVAQFRVWHTTDLDYVEIIYKR